ncbi:MurR/RpiR family transcriptional regulator [Agrobacterium sp. InxBP2]|uniref:MurR/RpiR family transcriptional regulator n=1 Tax=Agrobacterium sp. InxBP2 TaxID=2870329 RepID=UPI00249E5DE1|nr:MurR/RpiR family transcriptional regulator [Agrobacterium sp. InxBP2]MCW8281625.1 MurR/RpiR family transcriptional regulator [Agrobacterium sp. InxBP2]
MPEKSDHRGQSTSAPEDFENLSARIRARYISLPKRLAAIARYVLDSPDDVALNSATDIAAAAHVTPSALIRFAQLFGYDGFAAVQAIARDALRQKVSGRPGRNDTQAVERNGGPDDRFFGRAIDACHHVLDDLLSAVRTTDIQIAARIIARANCMFVIGRGSAFPVAVAMEHVLVRSKIKTILLTDVTGGEAQLTCAAPGDAAVVIACGADADQVAGLASTLVQQGVPVIAMTDTSLSRLAELASARLTLPSTEMNATLISIAGIALGEVLASSVSLLRNGKQCLT